MLCWGSSLTRNLRVNNTLATRRSPIKITNPDGFAITFQYDEANRAIRAIQQALGAHGARGECEAGRDWIARIEGAVAFSHRTD